MISEAPPPIGDCWSLQVRCAFVGKPTPALAKGSIAGRTWPLAAARAKVRP